VWPNLNLPPVLADSEVKPGSVADRLSAAKGTSWAVAETRRKKKGCCPVKQARLQDPAAGRLGQVAGTEGLVRHQLQCSLGQVVALLLPALLDRGPTESNLVPGPSGGLPWIHFRFCSPAGGSSCLLFFRVSSMNCLFFTTVLNVFTTYLHFFTTHPSILTTHPFILTTLLCSLKSDTVRNLQLPRPGQARGT
jgi:hypothetical protein